MAVPAGDERVIEVVASGLPLHHGAQLATDIMLRCATSADGLTPRELRTIQRRSADTRKDEQGNKVRGARRQQPLPLGGGGFGDRRPLERRSQFVDMMAAARAREVLPVLTRSVHLAWKRRWTRMLAVSCARSCAKRRRVSTNARGAPRGCGRNDCATFDSV